MNVLDENIPESQRQLLRSWRIRFRQIGSEVGRPGMKDEEILPLLHDLRSVTFLTRDLGFCSSNLAHPHYCLAGFAVSEYEFAHFVRRFLRHPIFNTQAKRSGKVVRVSHSGLRIWQVHEESERLVLWPASGSQASRSDGT
jgi:hypothetical protein